MKTAKKKSLKWSNISMKKYQDSPMLGVRSVILSLWRIARTSAFRSLKMDLGRKHAHYAPDLVQEIPVAHQVAAGSEDRDLVKYEGDCVDGYTGGRAGGFLS